MRYFPKLNIRNNNSKNDVFDELFDVFLTYEKKDMSSLIRRRSFLSPTSYPVNQVLWNMILSIIHAIKFWEVPLRYPVPRKIVVKFKSRISRDSDIFASN